MKTCIEYKGKVIEYNLSRSKRKTIGIRIKPDKSVTVTAPYRLTDTYIRSMVSKKADWIVKKLSEIDTTSVQERNYINGEVFSILGKEYFLDIKKEAGLKKAKAGIFGNSVIVTVPEGALYTEYKDIIQQALSEWLKEYASEIINRRLGFFAEIMGVKPNKILLKSQKTIWGSCTRENNVNINWKIIMAPVEIVDYLIVHELAHIKVKNHSKAFWSLVENVLPDHKARRKWLRENGQNLKI